MMLELVANAVDVQQNCLNHLSPRTNILTVFGAAFYKRLPIALIRHVMPEWTLETTLFGNFFMRIAIRSHGNDPLIQVILA